MIPKLTREEYKIHLIENWWKHLGTYDRKMVSGIVDLGDTNTFLFETDNWWDSLTNEQKEEIYDEFFEEY